MKMSVRPELTTAPPARVRDMRHTDGAVDNSALLPNHPGSTYKSGNAVQTAGATSIIIDNIVDRLFKTVLAVGLSYVPSTELSKNDRTKETQGALC